MAFGDLYGFASSAAGSASSAASSLFDFTPIVDTISGGFNWLKDNPEAAAALGGVAGAGLGYLKNREQIQARKDEIASERAYRSQFGGASTLDDSVYSEGLDITVPQSGIATDTGTVGPQNVGTVGQPPSMANALELRAQRTGFNRYG